MVHMDSLSVRCKVFMFLYVWLLSWLQVSWKHAWVHWVFLITWNWKWNKPVKSNRREFDATKAVKSLAVIALSKEHSTSAPSSQVSSWLDSAWSVDFEIDEREWTKCLFDADEGFYLVSRVIPSFKIRFQRFSECTPFGGNTTNLKPHLLYLSLSFFFSNTGFYLKILTHIQREKNNFLDSIPGLRERD